MNLDTFLNRLEGIVEEVVVDDTKIFVEGYTRGYEIEKIKLDGNKIIIVVDD